MVEEQAPAEEAKDEPAESQPPQAEMVSQEPVLPEQPVAQIEEPNIQVQSEAPQ